MTDKKSLEKAPGEAVSVLMVLYYQNGIEKAARAIGQRLNSILKSVTDALFETVIKTNVC